MAQIIPGTPGFGASFGEGLGAGLHALAQHKLGQVLERQVQKRDTENFEAAGFTPQESKFLSAQPAQLRPAYIQQLRPSGVGAQQNVQQLQQQAITPGEQEQVGLKDVMSSLQPRQQGDGFSRALSNLGGSAGQNYLQSLLNLTPQQDSAEVNNSRKHGNPVANPVQQVQAIPTVAQALTARGANPAAQSAELKERATINKEQRKESHDIAKGINESYKSSRESDTRLERMEKLANSGKLNSPAFASAVKGIKIPFIGHVGLPQGWLTPESQEFDKLSTDFVKGAKSVFGSRMTQGEVDLFLKTVPSLTNSDEGKKVLIRNLKIMNEGAKVKKDALDAIRKLNGGTYPPHLDELVEEVAGPRLEALKDKFIAGDEKLAAKEFQGLPDPATVSGKKFRDKKTGETVQAIDGKYVKVS